MRKTLINLGCGARYHPDWINIDVAPSGPDVIRHDLSRGIPLPDRSCDAVYHSHLLEHLRRPDASRFLRECFRVLRPGGVLRIATPDLERLSRDYVGAIERIDRGDASAADDAEWMRLELLDQMVRERTGGEMTPFFKRPTIRNFDFVVQRIGVEGKELRQQVQIPHRRRWPGLETAIRLGLHQMRRVAIAAVGGGRALRAYDCGVFRLGGEVHQWLYDRHSLANLLETSGFIRPAVHTAITSRIENWTGFHLDTLSDGAVIKPDSMYMEAERPPLS